MTRHQPCAIKTQIQKEASFEWGQVIITWAFQWIFYWDGRIAVVLVLQNQYRFSAGSWFEYEPCAWRQLFVTEGNEKFLRENKWQFFHGSCVLRYRDWYLIKSWIAFLKKKLDKGFLSAWRKLDSMTCRFWNHLKAN